MVEYTEQRRASDGAKLEMLTNGFFRCWRTLKEETKAVARHFLRAAVAECATLNEWYAWLDFIHASVNGALAREVSMVQEWFADLRMGIRFVAALTAEGVLALTGRSHKAHRWAIPISGSKKNWTQKFRYRCCPYECHNPNATARPICPDARCDLRHPEIVF